MLRRSTRRALSGLAAGALSVALYTPGVAASPPPDPRAAPAAAPRPDNRPGPLSARQDARRKAALAKVRAGEAEPDENGVVQLADDKYVETAVTGTDQVFTILAEFGTAGSGRLGTVPGPVHNAIQEPDRTSTTPRSGTRTSTTTYYEDLFFGTGESFNDFYAEAVRRPVHLAGDVSDWVTVPGNASTYGDNAVEDFGGAWLFVEDTGNAWYAAQLAAGRRRPRSTPTSPRSTSGTATTSTTTATSTSPTATSTTSRRSTPVRARRPAAAPRATDAIWSHRWYANSDGLRQHRPRRGNNARRHPDRRHRHLDRRLHDRARERRPRRLRPRVRPRPRSARPLRHRRWRQRHRLLDAHVAAARGSTTAPTPSAPRPATWARGRSCSSAGSTTRPCPSARTRPSSSARPTGIARPSCQALVVPLPERTDRPTTTTRRTPAQAEWWSGFGDDLNSTLLAASTSPAPVPAVSACRPGWHDIEADYDYLYGEVSTNGGATWTQRRARRSTASIDGH